MPGQEKMFSTSTAPVRTSAKARPMHRDDRRQRRPEHVAEDDGPLGQALGAGGTHVVVVEHLEHRRARVARDQADVVGGEHERRQDEVAERVPGDRPLARSSGVDGVHAR